MDLAIILLLGQNSSESTSVSRIKEEPSPKREYPRSGAETSSSFSLLNDASYMSILLQLPWQNQARIFFSKKLDQEMTNSGSILWYGIIADFVSLGGIRPNSFGRDDMTQKWNLILQQLAFGWLESKTCGMKLSEHFT